MTWTQTGASSSSTLHNFSRFNFYRDIKAGNEVDFFLTVSDAAPFVLTSDSSIVLTPTPQGDPV